MRTTPARPRSLRPLVIGWLFVGGYCLTVGLGPALLAGGPSFGERRLTVVQPPTSLAGNAGVGIADLATAGG